MKTITYIKSVLMLSAMALVVSCSNYGKKVMEAGTKGEVFYKGDGVTEADAQKLADYLKEIGYFDNSEKSVQLMKANGDGYDVHFVVNPEKLKTTPGVEEGFVGMGALISKNIFNDKAINIYLSDLSLKDIKSFPFDKEKAAALLAKNNSGLLDGYSFQKTDGISFYWKDPITDDQAEKIGNAVIATGAFSGGDSSTVVNIIMKTDGDRYQILFPVATAYQTNKEYIETLQTIGKQLKKAQFGNVPFSFVMTDEKLNVVRSFDY